jgi:hypothetical protein
MRNFCCLTSQSVELFMMALYINIGPTGPGTTSEARSKHTGIWCLLGLSPSRSTQPFFACRGVGPEKPWKHQNAGGVTSLSAVAKPIEVTASEWIICQTRLSESGRPSRKS